MEENISGDETQYYIMEPACGNNLTIKTPVDNRKVMMRKILSKDEVMSLIESLPDQETSG